MKFYWIYSTENLYFGIRKAASLNILKKSLLAKRDFLEVIFALYSRKDNPTKVKSLVIDIFKNISLREMNKGRLINPLLGLLAMLLSAAKDEKESPQIRSKALKILQNLQDENKRAVKHSLVTTRSHSSFILNSNNPDENADKAE